MNDEKSPNPLEGLFQSIPSYAEHGVLAQLLGDLAPASLAEAAKAVAEICEEAKRGRPEDRHPKIERICGILGDSLRGFDGAPRVGDLEILVWGAAIIGSFFADERRAAAGRMRHVKKVADDRKAADLIHAVKAASRGKLLSVSIEQARHLQPTIREHLLAKGYKAEELPSDWTIRSAIRKIRSGQS